MYKKLLPIALLFSSAIYSQTAKDTLWVNSFDEVTTKALASSFKVSKPAKQKGLEEIITYNKETKAIENKGFGSFDRDNNISYDGKVSYFNADGSLNFDMFYEQGNAIKITSIDPFSKEEYTLTYEEGYPHDGTMVQLYMNSYFYLTIEQGTYISYIYVNKNNEKQKFVYTFDDENYIKNEEFFDANGKSLYTATYESGSVQNGVSVTLNYDTFRPSAISTYKEGTNTAAEYFYTNGKTKFKTTSTATQTTTVFFDNKGTKIATYKADVDEYSGEKNQEGSYLYYNEYEGNADLPVSQSDYKKGNLIKETTFHTNIEKSVPKSIKYYKGDYYLEKIEYFNEDGSNKGELIYNKDGYTPENGVLYDEDSVTTYKNGVLVEKKMFYSSGEIFENATELQSTYYDKKGNVIGKLVSKKGDYGYIEPFEGDFITLTNDDIGSKITYSKGIAVYSATYEAYPDYDSKPILREENFTQPRETSKRIVYNRQGKKNREELLGELGYEENLLKVTYFDAKGKATGTFDNIEKIGTYYTFFENDAIESVSTYAKGELTYKKEYINKNGYYSTEITPYLASEINYNKEGVFYDSEGNQVAKASYKKGEPYTGTVSVNDGYSTTITSYKNGMKDGLETFKSEYSEYVSTKTYYTKGEIVKHEIYEGEYLQVVHNYEEGDLHGPTYYYDTEGEVIATLEYQQGVAYSGTEITYNYDSTVYHVYEEGVMISEQTIDPTTGEIISEEKMMEDGTTQRSTYDENGALVYQYGIKEYALHGTCTYFEKGKVKYQSTFDDGKLVSGTVALKSWGDAYTYNQQEDSYLVCSLQKNALTIKRLSIDTNKTIFELTSKLKKGNMEDNPILQTKVESYNLYPSVEAYY